MAGGARSKKRRPSGQAGSKGSDVETGPGTASTTGPDCRRPGGLAPDLAAFRDWWIASPDLAPGGFGARVPPRGEAAAANLFLVPEPDADDAATLLSGPQGNLLRSFLDAAGLAEADCYFASALPATITMPDWQELRARGLDALLAHHLGLARPQRIIAFGRNLLPLLGHDTAQAATNGLQFTRKR